MRKTIFFTLVLSLVFQTVVLAASPVAQKIKDAYAGLNSFEANFEQTLTHKESNTTERRTGSMLFQKPLSIRWSTAKPHEELIVVNSKEIWNYLPDEQLAYIYPPDAIGDANGILPVVTGQARLQDDFDVKPNGKAGDLTRLLLYPKNPTPQLVEAEIWVDEKTGLIKRAAILDFYGNGNEVRFTSFKPGAKIAPGKFNFKAPAGVEVEDRRKKGM